MKFVITIDVEEDDWGHFISEGYRVENVKKIVGLQEVFDQFKAKPTYLINYPVATDELSVDMFRRFLAEGKCEVGAHCHPWNTPPFEEELNITNSMLCNLPEQLQYQKLETLKKTICKNLGVVPVSFRAGRWAFSSGVAQSLYTLGFKIDTSVSPYTEWLEWHGTDYRNCTPHPYLFSVNDIFKAVEGGELLQVPASIGYLQKNYARCCRLSRFVEGGTKQKMRLRGLLYRLKIFNKVSLSPEVSTGQEMIKLAKRMKGLGFGVLNLFFHSTTLLSGCSPFNKTPEEERKFMSNLIEFLEYVSSENMESICLKDTLKLS